MIHNQYDGLSSLYPSDSFLRRSGGRHLQQLNVLEIIVSYNMADSINLIHNNVFLDDLNLILDYVLHNMDIDRHAQENPYTIQSLITLIYAVSSATHSNDICCFNL